MSRTASDKLRAILDTTAPLVLDYVERPTADTIDQLFYKDGFRVLVGSSVSWVNTVAPDGASISTDADTSAVLALPRQPGSTMTVGEFIDALNIPDTADVTRSVFAMVTDPETKLKYKDIVRTTL